jgi:tRNA (uracil-5-)-methyltransferase TRM9
MLMDETTIRRLNEINRRFYATVTAEFDATRQKAWAGWEDIIRNLTLPLHVLDVGCGNGRFGIFLIERLGKDGLHYVGLDSSAILLNKARESLVGIDARLEQRDIVEQPPDEALGQFDLVALFGVLHHIPGADRRRALIRSLAERVAPGGRLAFTEWRFYEVERLRERIVPWDADWQVEAGDYLLDWRRGGQRETAPALRYCHYVDDAEHAGLIAAAGLPVLAEYHADAANVYTLLRKG